jgi:hypothetical protein
LLDQSQYLVGLALKPLGHGIHNERRHP